MIACTYSGWDDTPSKFANEINIMFVTSAVNYKS
jgi:hypothetical protein